MLQGAIDARTVISDMQTDTRTEWERNLHTYSFVRLIIIPSGFPIYLLYIYLSIYLSMYLSIYENPSPFTCVGMSCEKRRGGGGGPRDFNGENN